MKPFVVMALLLMPLTLKAQFLSFTPLPLTNNGYSYLAFPDWQGPSVLYWLGVANAYKTKSEIRGLVITNIEKQTIYQIQYVTNNIELKKKSTRNEGKIIGAIVGSLVIGVSSGLVLSDLKNPNNGTYLGLGAAVGGGLFAAGFVIDLGGSLKKKE